ncbi:MAG: FAD-dependent oxidoreductase [Proteiniphilum sp.]|nr:FAD-dependent oxidoreductase [Proteiniphilum sp.]
MKRDGQLESIWQSEGKHYGQENLTPDARFDVVIAGAGITGITCALMLQKKGVKCILVEASNMGFGTSGGTTAHLTSFFDTPYYQVISHFGLDAAKLLAQGANEAHHLIKDHINLYQIYCDYSVRNGYLFSLDTEQDKTLQKIIAGNQKVGVDTFETKVNPFGIPSVRVVEIPNQAQFHPLKYLRILLKEFINSGGTYVENCRVISVEKEDHQLVSTTTKGNIISNQLVYATHIPPGRNILHFRNAPYRSYVMACKLKNGSYPEALGYDLSKPYHYYRVHSLDEKQFIIAGGEDHKTGDVNHTSESFERLGNYLHHHFDIEEISYQWSSQFYESADGLPYIGQLPGGPEKVYCATGYNGDGMILGTLAAKVLSDIISVGSSKYENLFLPSRVTPVAESGNIIKETANVIKHFVADKLAVEKMMELADLENDQGKVINHKGNRLAVYKDANGHHHILESDCTHLYCTVKWNEEEKSWDCPCHGSRFGRDGKVLNGPAVTPLKEP